MNSTIKCDGWTHEQTDRCMYDGWKNYMLSFTSWWGHEKVNKQEAHRPQFAHLSKTAIAYLSMLN